jgi:RNA polymerase sigma-70 factor (ECF subfamily)
MDRTNRQTGVDDRLARWIEDHGRAVEGYLLSLVRDPNVVDDLLQEVFCRAWQARHRYEEAGKERAYLLTIADRLVRDRHRRAWRETPVAEERWQLIEPADRSEPPLESLARREAEQQLSEALVSLSEPQRRTLLLRYYGGLDFSEIAHALGCPLNTVLSHCRRGLQALRRLLVEEMA